MAATSIRLALVLGLLALAGPFAIDMYLPALPVLAADLGVAEPAAQASLTAFFVAFGLAQMLYGPWSDQVGRKLPIYFGYGVFLIASIGAATSGSIATLVAWRVMQGVGAAVAMVIPRAVIRDIDTGPAATRLMALIMLVIAISPMIAPLAGSFVILFTGWRGIFIVIAGMSVLSLLLTRFVLPETLALSDRVPVRFKTIRAGLAVLLVSPKFMALTFVAALSMSSFFVFISFAPFVYTERYGLTPTGFSIAFAVNAIGFFTASQLAAPLGARFGMLRVARVGSGLAAVAMILLCLILATGLDGIALVVGGLFIGNAFLGVVVPTVMVMALDDHGDIAGLASSLGGTLQMTTGGLAIALASLFFDGSATTMVAIMALCVAGCFGLALYSARR